MEDRVTPVLQLEMSDLAPGQWLGGRGNDLLAIDGVERVSAWTNCAPHRSDLPRTLAEFQTLGVVEAREPFATPAPPEGVIVHQFRQCRPGQGVLSGRPTRGLELVLISPKSEAGAQALRDWADFVHIRHIAEAAVPGMTMTTPYVNAAGTDPLFLHFYEMDDADAEATFKRMTPLVTTRLGGMDTPEWKHWANCPELRIMYVNSFTRIGAVSSTS